jgi:hypothetical protein
MDDGTISDHTWPELYYEQGSELIIRALAFLVRFLAVVLSFTALRFI